MGGKVCDMIAKSKFEKSFFIFLFFVGEKFFRSIFGGAQSFFFTNGFGWKQISLEALFISSFNGAFGNFLIAVLGCFRNLTFDKLQLKLLIKQSFLRRPTFYLDLLIKVLIFFHEKCSLIVTALNLCEFELDNTLIFPKFEKLYVNLALMLCIYLAFNSFN